MTRTAFTILTVASLSLLPLGGCRRDSAPGVRPGTEAPAVDGIDLAGMDTAVAPGDDFFRFANGSWLKTTDIPPDRSSYGIWSVLVEQAQTRTRELLDGVAAGNAPAGSEERKIGDFYASYMDEATIETRGLAPVRATLSSIAAIADTRSLSTWIGSGLRADVDPLNATEFHTDRLLGVWVSQDLNDPTRHVPYLLQGGLGMPDRDYYLEPGERMQAIRSAYRSHVARTLELTGLTDAATRAERIVDLERRIADAHWTRTASADILKANNVWARDAFSRRAPGIDWDAFFDAAGLGHASTVLVWQPSAVTGIAALVRSVPLSTWRDYLTFHEIDRNGGLLPKAFVDERFAFYGKVLSGTPQLRERWKRGVDTTNAMLGDAVGRLYVRRYFPSEFKTQLQAMVANIVAAFDKRLDRLTWLSPGTKAGAKAKLATLTVGVGYPDTWRDYGALQIARDDLFGNVQRAELFEYRHQLAKLGQVPDSREWWITPQTVNALNLPLQNALNFPAAILEPPFFDPAASAAARYGAIGATIGHEISHSFDDTGSQFDANGRLVNWWTPEDLARFEAASARLVAQYDAYKPFPDLHVNGQLTLGENIADVAGLAAAYDAYRASGEFQGAEGDRHFFISYAQSWRSKDREALARQLVLTDGHAPDEYRALTVRNIDAWYDAFDVQPGHRLYLSPADRVRVW